MKYLLLIAVILSPCVISGCYAVATGAAIDHIEREDDKDEQIRELQERLDQLERRNR